MVDKVGVVVGHYRAGSRTAAAARRLAAAVADGTDVDVIELADYQELLLSEPDHPTLRSLRANVSEAYSILVVASPTYKGTYTGILKLFFEQFAGGSGLQGRVGVPMMMAGSPGHAMAGEVFLKPLLVELGAICPASALVVAEDEAMRDAEISRWYERWGAPIRSAARDAGR